MKRPNRVARPLAAILAVVVLGGIAALGVPLRPYWIAKYRGEGADLHGTALPFAPLRGAHLRGANLHSTDLTSAKLADADLERADLTGADLTCADLHRASLVLARLHERGCSKRPARA